VVKEGEKITAKRLSGVQLFEKGITAEKNPIGGIHMVFQAIAGSGGKCREAGAEEKRQVKFAGKGREKTDIWSLCCQMEGLRTTEAC